MNTLVVVAMTVLCICVLFLMATIALLLQSVRRLVKMLWTAFSAGPASTGEREEALAYQQAAAAMTGGGRAAPGGPTDLDDLSGLKYPPYRSNADVGL